MRKIERLYEKMENKLQKLCFKKVSFPDTNYDAFQFYKGNFRILTTLKYNYILFILEHNKKRLSAFRLHSDNRTFRQLESAFIDITSSFQELAKNISD